MDLLTIRVALLNGALSLAGLLAALPATAQEAGAFTCSFTRECYEDEACGEAGFAVAVDVAGKAMRTDYGDLVIVAIKETGLLTTAFATGAGAEYMLSLSPATARFTIHTNDGPQVISYLGHCEGAF